MEKVKILNIADNLLLLKENHKNYIEIKENGDFESYNKKKNLYNNWIVVLCDMYNSLLKYYKDVTDEKWERIKLFVSQTYKYEENEITMSELIKKYRNKNVHSENPDSVENNLLPIVVSDVELERLQTMIIDIINCEIENVDINEIVNHTLKSGSNIIVYKMFINSINESMKNATNKEKEMLEIPYCTLQNLLNKLTDESLLSEEDLKKIEKDLIAANDIINESEFIKLMLEHPNGQDTLDFLKEIRTANSIYDIYDSCINFKKKILNDQ